MTSRPTKVSSVLPAKARRDPVFQEPRSTSPNDSFLQDTKKGGMLLAEPTPPLPGHKKMHPVAPVFVVPFVCCALAQAQNLPPTARPAPPSPFRRKEKAQPSPPPRQHSLPLPTKCNRMSNRHQEKKTLSLHLHSCSRGCVLPRFRPLALGTGNAILSVFPFGVKLEGLRFPGSRPRKPSPVSHTLLLHCFSQSPLGSAHS